MRTVAPVLLLGLALALRVWNLDLKNIWLDEAWAWKQTTRPVPELLIVSAGDVHSPLFPLVLKAWAGLFGDSPNALRSPSVLASLLAIFLTFRLGRAYLPRAALLGVLLWLSVSPHMLDYAQEARMYAMTTAAALGACTAYRRWIDSGMTRTPALAAWEAWAAAAIYLHYFGALVIVATWVHYLVFARESRSPGEDSSRARRRLVPWAAANAAIAAAFAPWLPFAARQIVRGQSWREAASASSIPGHAADLASGMLLGADEASVFASPSGVVLILIAALGLGRLVFVVVSGRGHERDAFLGTVCVVPPLLALAALPWTGHMSLSRYLSFLLPLVVLAIARGLSTFDHGPRFAVAAVLLGAAASVPPAISILANPFRDSDVRPIVGYLESRGAPDGSPRAAVLVAPGYMTLCTDYYVRSSGLAWVGMNDRARLSRAIVTASSWPGDTWVVLDSRSPDFAHSRQDPRLVEVDVPGGQPDRIRLFLVRRG
jgi:hypothetical protein